MLDIALLGTAGMMPLPNRFLSSFICKLNGKMMIIDCGEGTQVSLKILGWGFKNIDIICFTHYHADHISGLPGLLLTIGNCGRTEPLTLVGPRGIAHVVNHLRVIAPELPYEIEFIELLGESAEFLSIGEFSIGCQPVNHIIPCFAYNINIFRMGKFDAERALQLNLPRHFWGILQKNETVFYEGVTYTSEMVMGKPRKGLKVSYCTDSRPTKELETFIAGSDIFICEGMYGEDDKYEKALYNRHMLFSEAATLANRSNSKELWLTHFSPSLSEPDSCIKFATDIFQNTRIGHDRMSKTLYFENQT